MPSNEELETYPQVLFTSDMTWELQVFDNEYDAENLVYLSEDDLAMVEYHASSINDYGEFNWYENDDPELYTNYTSEA
jgi:hypothetical protein